MFLRAGIGIFAVVACVCLQPPEAAAQSTNQRLNKLEDKTDYYLKRDLKRTHKYRRAPRSLAAADGVCNESVVVTLSSGVTLPSTSNAWLTANVQFTGDPGTVFVNWGPANDGTPCSASAPANGSGTVELKKFCSFSADPDIPYKLRFGVGQGDACIKIVNIETTLKLTNIEMVEPE